MAQDPKYIKELSERRKQNPQEFEKEKEMYDAAKQKEAEDKDYSALDALKRMGKKAVGMKKGGKVKCMARGGGCEVRGKTKGRFV